MLGTALRWVSPGAGLRHNAVISNSVAPPSSEGKLDLFSSGLCMQRLLAPPTLGAAAGSWSRARGQVASRAVTHSALRPRRVE